MHKPFNFLGIEDETCQINLLSSSTKFKTTIIKPYLLKDENTKNHSSTPTKMSFIAQNSQPDTKPLFVVKDITI